MQPVSVAFVTDVTVPDGSVLTPGEKALKVWRLRNSGCVSFPHGVQLIHAGGDAMGVSASAPVGCPFPGDEFEVAVPLVAPLTPGRHFTCWGLSLDGIRFGNLFFAEVMVREVQTS